MPHKEQADHNLKYLAAVALLYGEVSPAQFSPERIKPHDVQSLLRRADVRPNEAPRAGRMPVRMSINLQDGRIITGEKATYRGFHTTSMDWTDVEAKFERLTAPHLGAKQ